MPPGALARKISARNSQLLFGRIISSGDWDAATAVPPATAQDGQFWKATSAGVYGGATIPVGALCLFSENLTVVHYLVQEAGAGGGASLLDWDLTSVPGAVTHEVTPFPPEILVPNSAVIVGDAMTLTIPAASSVYASSRLSATIEAGDKVYFYVRPYAVTGAATLESYNLILGGGITASYDEPYAQFGFPPEGGITLYSDQLLEGTVMIDPAFSLGDAFLVYVDMVAGTVGVKTAAVDTTENIVCLMGTQAYNLIESASDGAGVAQMDLSSTDLGSGITPPVGYTALSGRVPAGLPVGAVDGDHLKVTVGGTYDAVTYEVDDLAVVLDAGTGAVFPVEEKSVPVPVPAAAWVETYAVTVGVGGMFPDFQALMLDIEDNKRQGDTLGITFTDTALTANDTLLRVPSFKKITLKAPAPMTNPADPNFVFTLDGLANEYIELQGEIQAPYINGFNVLLVPLDLTGQTGLYATARYNLNGVYGDKVTVGAPYPYIRCGTAIGAVLRDVGYVRGLASGYSTESKLEIGFTTANTGVTFLFGYIGGLIKTNRPVSLVNAYFNISTLKNISLSNITGSLVTAVGGSYGRIINVNCGAAGLATVLNAEYAAIHVNNITGTYTDLAYADRLINVFDKNGGIFYDDWTGDQWVDVPLPPEYTSYGPALLKVRSVSDRVDIVCKVNLDAAVNTGNMLNVNPIPFNCRPDTDTFVVGTYDDVGGHKSVHLMVRTDGMLQFYGPSIIPDGSEISINTSFYIPTSPNT